MTLSGNLRYNDDNAGFQPPGKGNELQRRRHVFRLRSNFNHPMSDHFYIALGVATNDQAASRNQPTTAGFDGFGIYPHRFLPGWKAAPDATFAPLLQQRGRQRGFRRQRADRPLGSCHVRGLRPLEKSKAGLRGVFKSGPRPLGRI